MNSINYMVKENGLIVINRIVDSAFVASCIFLLMIFFYPGPNYYLANLPGSKSVFVFVYCVMFLILGFFVLYKLDGFGDSAIALILTFTWSPQYWLLVALPLGDNWFAQAQQLQCCMFSEALSHAFYKFLFLNELWYLTPYIAPIAGSVSSYLIFRTLLLLTSDNSIHHRKEWRFISIMLFAASGVHLIFFKGYLETTQLATPLALLSVYLLIRFCQTGRMIFSYYAAFFFSLAFLMHGSHIFWWPVLIMVPLYMDCYYNKSNFGYLALLPGLLSVLLIAMIFLVISSGEGFIMFAGGAAGGGDGKMLVPLSVMSSEYEHYLLFSREHFSDVVTIMATVNFFFMFAGPFYLLTRKKKFKGKVFTHDPISLLLILIFLAHFAMVFFWNFDMGYPQDYDLMTSMGTLWLSLPLLLVIITQTRPAPVVWVILLFGVIINRLNISLYLI